MDLNGYSVDKVRNHNLKLIMHCLFEKDLSCKELACVLGLSETAIKKNVVQLLENNIIAPVEEDSSIKKAVGRQHIRYSIKGDFGHFVLLDFSYGRDEFFVTDIRGKELFHEKFKINVQITKEEVNNVLSRIQEVCKANDYQVKEMAISIPGQVNEETGVINYSSRLDKGGITNPKEMAAAYFPNIQIIVKNDLRYSVYGDKKILQRSTNTIASYFSIGYGIISTYVKDGSIIQGYNGISGEIGGINRIDRTNVHETCSIRALISKVNQIVECNDFNDLLRLYKENKQVHDIVIESAEYLSYDIDCISCALGSSNIIIFGEVSKFGKDYENAITKHLEKIKNFERKVTLIDAQEYRKEGMVKKLQDHIIRCIK